VKEKGILNRWKSERGFGFIKSDSIESDIFIHISKLKYMSRKPIIGDVIYFDLHTDKAGKLSADNASIEGVSVKKITKTSNRKSKNGNSISNIIFWVLVLMSAFYLYQTFSPKPDEWSGLFKKEDFSMFSCQGKQHCSQMISCKEARFYLKSCPNVKIDGDGDGVPCEQQLCR
jgi:cold shock CspA family protein